MTLVTISKFYFGYHTTSAPTPLKFMKLNSGPCIPALIHCPKWLPTFQNYIYLIPGSGQNGSQGQQGQKTIYTTTGNPPQRIIRSTNQQPIQRIVQSGARLVPSSQVQGNQPQGRQIVYRAPPSGDRSQVGRPGKSSFKFLRVVVVEVRWYPKYKS